MCSMCFGSKKFFLNLFARLMTRLIRGFEQEQGSSELEDTRIFLTFLTIFDTTEAHFRQPSTFMSLRSAQNDLGVNTNKVDMKKHTIDTSGYREIARNNFYGHLQKNKRHTCATSGTCLHDRFRNGLELETLPREKWSPSCGKNKTFLVSSFVTR